MIQKICSKIYYIFCANAHHGVTDFEFDVMVRNSQDQISPERNMALPPT